MASWVKKYCWLWWAPAVAAAGIATKIYGLPGQSGEGSILGSVSPRIPLTRYQFAGAYRTFVVFRDVRAAAIEDAMWWMYAFIIFYTVALFLACIYFVRMYQSPWMRLRGPTLAAGVVLAGGMHGFAWALTLRLVSLSDESSIRGFLWWDIGLDSVQAENLVGALMWVSFALILAGIAYAGFGLGLFFVRRVLSNLGRVLSFYFRGIVRDVESPAFFSQHLPVPDFENSSVVMRSGMTDDGEGAIGICSSGGGLRSATFNLGAYQGLSDEGILEKARYISAVSGGAYMAGGYSAVSTNLDEDQAKAFTAYEHRSSEEDHLRRNSNYLAPSFVSKVGVMLRVLLGLGINLVFIGAVVGLFALPWGWLISARYLYPDPLDQPTLATRSAAQSLVFTSTELTNMLSGDVGGPPPELRDFAGKLDSAGSALDREYRKGVELDLDGLLARTPRQVLVIAADARDLSSAIFAIYTDEAEYVPRKLALRAEAITDDAQDLFDYIEGLSKPSIAIDPAALAVGLAAWAGLLIALTSVGIRRFNESDRTRLSLQRFAILLIGVAVWLFLTFYLLPWLLIQRPDDLLDRSVDALVALQSIGAAVLAVGAVRTIVSRRVGRLAALAGGFVAPVMAVLAVFAFIRIGSRTSYFWWWFGGFLAIYLVVMAVGDLNVWSLHPWYRRRLSTAFGVFRNRLGAIERLDGDRTLMSHYRVDRGNADPRSGFLPPPAGRPAPVICAAVNTNEPGQTPAAMNAMSFTFDGEKMGIPGLELIPRRSQDDAADMDGAMPFNHAMVVTSVAEKRIVRQRQDISLMGAVAISGAAVSPGMGKMSRRSVQSLLAIANIRLGVWLPNPIWLNELMADAEESRMDAEAVEESLKGRFSKILGEPVVDALFDHLWPPAGHVKWREKVRASYLFKEIFGTYRLSDKFLYVSDGGHWENLGLVELLRRQCSTIYCFDASGDSIDRFKTLSEAVAIARSELGIELGDIDPHDQRGEPTEDTKDDDAPVMRSRSNHSVFDFEYPSGRPGRIVYCKPVVTDRSPIDVREYQEANRQFPAQSTLDQLFDHEQFEAYRMIGYAAGKSAATAARQS